MSGGIPAEATFFFAGITSCFIVLFFFVYSIRSYVLYRRNKRVKYSTIALFLLFLAYLGQMISYFLISMVSLKPETIMFFMMSFVIFTTLAVWLLFLEVTKQDRNEKDFRQLLVYSLGINSLVFLIIFIAESIFTIAEPIGQLSYGLWHYALRTNIGNLLYFGLFFGYIGFSFYKIGQKLQSTIPSSNKTKLYLIIGISTITLPILYYIIYLPLFTLNIGGSFVDHWFFSLIVSIGLSIIFHEMHNLSEFNLGEINNKDSSKQGI